LTEQNIFLLDMKK